MSGCNIFYQLLFNITSIPSRYWIRDLRHDYYRGNGDKHRSARGERRGPAGLPVTDSSTLHRNPDTFSKHVTLAIHTCPFRVLVENIDHSLRVEDVAPAKFTLTIDHKKTYTLLDIPIKKDVQDYSHGSNAQDAFVEANTYCGSNRDLSSPLRNSISVGNTKTMFRPSSKIGVWQ